MIMRVQDELLGLEKFRAKAYISEECERLKLEVSEATSRAIKHIEQQESELRRQIDEYGRRCLAALDAEASAREELNAPTESTQRQLDALAKEITEFSVKWTNYFGQSRVAAEESVIKGALDQGRQFQEQIKQLEQKLKINSLNGSAMQFEENRELCAQTGHLGQLVEILARKGELSLVWEK